MVALLEAKDASLLDPNAVRSICKAEVSNKAILESEGLCDNYCAGASTTCLFPLSLVRVIRSYIGDSNHLPCDDLAQVYEDVQDTFTQQLLDCANELKDNLGEIGGNTTCPLEFSAMMVDKDFGVEGNSFLKYSVSIYPTSSVDSLNLFNKVEELSWGDENIGIIYESRFDNFEEHAIDEAVKADLVCTFVYAKPFLVFCDLIVFIFCKVFRGRFCIHGNCCHCNIYRIIVARLCRFTADYTSNSTGVCNLPIYIWAEIFFSLESDWFLCICCLGRR